MLSRQVSIPVLGAIPDYLLISDLRTDSGSWSVELDRVDSESMISNREVMLRYLLSRAIVDQGSDSEGVEMWHSSLLSECYDRGFRVLHSPEQFVSNYVQILEIGSQVRDYVVADRAEIWAAGSENRKAGHYTPFNIDGLRGGKQAHWFLSARLFPSLLLATARPNGLVELVFGNMENETPLEMSRRLRSDKIIGLGYCIGDKACDLFVKWALGSYRLAAGLGGTWDPTDIPIPMDQRIGRLVTRFGLMDEFFGVIRMMSKKRFGFSPEDGQNRPDEHDNKFPAGRWFLSVMDFRRTATVTEPAAKAWLEAEWRHHGGAGRTPRFGPQKVVSILCKSINEHLGTTITPVEMDDHLMGLGGSVCTDQTPTCDQCVLSLCCQANSHTGLLDLKSCYT